MSYTTRGDTRARARDLPPVLSGSTLSQARAVPPHRSPMADAGGAQGGRKRKRASGWDTPAATAPAATAPGGALGAAEQLALAQQKMFMQQQLRMGMAVPMGSSMTMPGQTRGGPGMPPMAMRQMAVHAQARVSLTGQVVIICLARLHARGRAYPTLPCPTLPYRTNHPTPSHQFDTSKANMRRQMQLMMAQKMAQKQVRRGGPGVPSRIDPTAPQIERSQPAYYKAINLFEDAD